MRGGQSGSFRLAKALEAFIGFKLSSEPCARKLFEDMHSCQKSQKHESIIALSHAFSFTILVPIQSQQLLTYYNNDRQKYSLRSRRKRIKNKVGGLLKKSAKTNDTQKNSQLNNKMKTVSPSEMLFLCGLAPGLPWARLEWVLLRVSHHILSPHPGQLSHAPSPKWENTPFSLTDWKAAVALDQTGSKRYTVTYLHLLQLQDLPGVSFLQCALCISREGYRLPKTWVQNFCWYLGEAWFVPCSHLHLFLSDTNRILF